jgi:predicted peroxiredoxin
MGEKLGILVSSDKHLDYVVSLTAAAHEKGKSVHIFFTGDGVRLTRTSKFQELVGKAKISLCDVSYRALGFEGDIPGLGFKDFATQAKNAEMVKECDGYVVF